MGEHLGALQQALQQSVEQSNATAAVSQENQRLVMDRQQAMLEYIDKNNQTLAAAIGESQAQVHTAQIQAALSNVGVLFANYQERHRELRERLEAAAPSEVVVDVSQEMVNDSDALIQQLLSQLQEAQQQEPPAEDKG